MNFKKAQKDVFNNLLDGARVAKFEIDEDYVFITPNGYYGFVFPKVMLQINLERIKTINAIDIYAAINEENKCVLTDECKILHLPHKGYARKLKRGETEIFVNEKYLVYYQNPNFYIAASNLIVVTENTSKSDNTIVGIVCPMKM